jgi:hypothetical protein
MWSGNSGILAAKAKKKVIQRNSWSSSFSAI